MHFAPPAEIFGMDGIIVLVVVVLVLFGSTQIPKLARSLGSAQKEFKKGLDEGSSEDGKGTPAVAQAAPPAEQRRSLFGTVTGLLGAGRRPAGSHPHDAEPAAPRAAPVLTETRPEPARASVSRSTGEEVGLDIPAFLRRQSS